MGAATFIIKLGGNVYECKQFKIMEIKNKIKKNPGFRSWEKKRIIFSKWENRGLEIAIKKKYLNNSWFFLN